MIAAVNGTEFLRRVRRIGKRRNIPVRFDAVIGKGSHGVLFFGRRSTVIKDRKKEIGAGLLAAMLRRLGLSKRDL